MEEPPITQSHSYLEMSDDDQSSQGDGQWFKERLDYDDDTEDQVEDDFDAENDDVDFFFSDVSMDEDDSEIPDKFSLKKTAQIGAEVAQARHQINSSQLKLEECQKIVENTRYEIIQCNERQSNLAKDIGVAEGEVRAHDGNITIVKRLLNVIDRLNRELEAEKELEKDLQIYVQQQELALNHALHNRDTFQPLEESLKLKEKTLNDIKRDLVTNRKEREQKIVKNAERSHIKANLTKSLWNVEHEERTRAAIEAAKKSQQDSNKFLKETWKRVREAKRKEEMQKQKEVDRRVKTLLEFKDNLHRSQATLRKQSIRKAKIRQESEKMKQSMHPEERLRNERKSMEVKVREEFDAKQEEGRLKVVEKLLKEESSINKRKALQPHLFKKRLQGRLNKPTTNNYDYIINPAFNALEEMKEVPTQQQVTVGLSSSSDEDERRGWNDEHTDEEDLTTITTEPKLYHGASVDGDGILMEPEFPGLWQKEPGPKPPKVSNFSVLEKRKMADALERQKAGIVHKQITVQREFKGQAFVPKPEIVLFSDFDVGKVYTQNITLTNVSYTINSVKFIAISDNLLDFVSVNFIPPGHMSAGLTCDLRVTFEPLVEEDITGEIKMLALTGPFSIPVHCRIKRSEITVPKQAHDFGTVCVGEHRRVSLALVNSGALATKFFVMEKSRFDSQSYDEFPSTAGRTVAEKGLTSTIDALVLPSDSLLSITETFQRDDQRSPSPLPSLSKPEISVLSESGEVPARASTDVVIDYHPHSVDRHMVELVVVFEDKAVEPVVLTLTAHTIDLPVYVEQTEMYIKYCMVDRLYQDSIVVHNRSSAALRIKFEVPRSLRDHFDILPLNGVVQASSSFSAQFKFIPLPGIFTECADFFDEDQLLRIPVQIRVADQTRPVPFEIRAHVTGTNVSFSSRELSFGSCSIYESVRVPFAITNECLLPQMYGFVSLPEFITIQPNDGFGTLLPGETLELEAVFHAKILGEHRFNIVCTTDIDRHFTLKCVAIGVIPHLEVSHSTVRFAPTALGDVKNTSFYVTNTSNRTPSGDHVAGEVKSFHIAIPEDLNLTASPSVGTVHVGHKVRVQLSFAPKLLDKDVKEEATKMVKDRMMEEYEKKKAEALEAQRQSELAGASNKKVKSRKAPSKMSNPRSPGADSVDSATPNLDNVDVTINDMAAASVKMKANYKGYFQKVLIPCFTAPGECSPESPLPWKYCDIVYLQVHLPTIKPEMILISQSGKSVIDFGNVPMGQSKKIELTLKSITNDVIDLSCSYFPHDGSFQKINATRSIQPHGLHQMILEFAPKRTARYYEVVEIKSQRSGLYLHLHGHGVTPSLEVDKDSIDMGHVMVGEVIQKTFTLQNTSLIDLNYEISLRSHLSQVTQSMTQPSEIGNSNISGVLPFQCDPHVGVVKQGESKEVKVMFSPDQSGFYKDFIVLTLLNQPHEKRIAVSGSGCEGSMYVEGGGDPNPVVNLQTLTPIMEVTSHEEEMVISGHVYLLFICSQKSSKTVVTQSFTIGNCRGLGMKPVAQNAPKDKGVKSSGDYSIDPLKAEVGPLAKAFTFTPQKGSVDVAAPQEVSVSLTLPKDFDMSESQHCITTTLSLKGETNQFYKLVLVVKTVE